MTLKRLPMVTQVCQTYLQKIVNDSLAFDSKCGSLGLMLVIFFNVVHFVFIMIFMMVLVVL